MSPTSEPIALDIAALEDVAAVEAAAARALPALEAVRRGGWLLRATPGVTTRRLNSVIARDDDPNDPLDERIDDVERFYARRDQPARFYLTPVSRPLDLESVLRARGYVHESTTLVRVGEVRAMAGEGQPPRLRVTLEATPGSRWLTTWCAALGTAPDRQAAPRALWQRIASPCAFALVTEDDMPVGVGMAVRDDGWVGVFNLATLPEARRRGVARAALRALAAWGADGGATRVYLQVDQANAGALALYERAGMHAAYNYSYLVRGERVAGPP